MYSRRDSQSGAPQATHWRSRALMWLGQTGRPPSGRCLEPSGDPARRGRCRSPSRRRTSLNRPDASVIAAKGQAAVASTKCRPPPTKSAVMEHRVSTPPRGPFRSTSRTVRERTRCVKRLRANEILRSAYSRKAPVTSLRLPRTTKSIGIFIGIPPFATRLEPTPVFMLEQIHLWLSSSSPEPSTATVETTGLGFTEPPSFGQLISCDMRCERRHDQTD